MTTGDVVSNSATSVTARPASRHSGQRKVARRNGNGRRNGEQASTPSRTYHGAQSLAPIPSPRARVGEARRTGPSDAWTPDGGQRVLRVAGNRQPRNGLPFRGRVLLTRLHGKAPVRAEAEDGQGGLGAGWPPPGDRPSLLELTSRGAVRGVDPGANVVLAVPRNVDDIADEPVLRGEEQRDSHRPKGLQIVGRARHARRLGTDCRLHVWAGMAAEADGWFVDERAARRSEGRTP